MNDWYLQKKKWFFIILRWYSDLDEMTKKENIEIMDVKLIVSKDFESLYPELWVVYKSNEKFRPLHQYD